MDLDDAANVTSVYTVKTMDGNDNITITDVAATSVIDAGAGNDTINAAVTGVAITVKAGDGVDAITVADGSDASIDGGNDSDTIKVADNANLSDDDVTWTNIEKIEITGGNTGITLSEAQLDSDGTWELQNTAGVVTVNAASGKGTLSAAGVTFVAGSSAGFKLVGVDGQADVLTGSSKADTFDGGTGADTLTGGSGLDKFVIAAGDSTAAAMDKIADFNNGGTEVIDYGNNLTKATNTSGTNATSGNASIDANGLATFHADDTTLALKIAAVNADIAGANTTVADLVAIFQHGGNTYVFISGGTDGATTDDTVIELTGVSLSTVTVDGNNDFTGG
jgi:Ca2+-binding RTX toxin-like protein